MLSEVQCTNAVVHTLALQVLDDPRVQETACSAWETFVRVLSDTGLQAYLGPVVVHMLPFVSPVVDDDTPASQNEAAASPLPASVTATATRILHYAVVEKRNVVWKSLPSIPFMPHAPGLEEVNAVRGVCLTPHAVLTSCLYNIACARIAPTR